MFHEFCPLDLPLDEFFSSLLLAQVEVAFDSEITHIISHSHDTLQALLLGFILLFLFFFHFTAVFKTLFQIDNHDMLLIIPDLVKDAHSYLVHTVDYTATILHLLVHGDSCTSLLFQVF